ncbi:MAG TPA: RagB/SusD family nutrient uptake outer membrane protein [Bacteroidales bacterium]|nr:RagB/SusD family nutrient uptake outer membrane protein [Bacteroidales bacterium]
MKTKIKSGLLLVMALTSLSSCSQWLNLEPEDGVIRDRFWKTKEEAHSAVNGCYTSLMENNMMERYFIWGELRADMVVPTPSANENIIAINNGEIVSSNSYTDWSYFYKTINQCNTVLELAKKAQVLDMSFSTTLLKQYEAEVTCIRSLAYFYLLRTFRDVPYVTKASIYDDQNFAVPATPQAQIVDSLIASLRRVENDLPFSYNDMATNKGHFNALSLRTLLADIYLWKGDYDYCIDLCSQVIGSGQYSLVPVGRQQVLVDGATPGVSDTVYYVNEGDVSSYFTSMYAQGNSVESIFELQFQTDKSNPFCNLFLPGGYAKMQAKMENLSSEYFITSNIDRGWFDMRGEGVSYKQGYIWKWIGLSKDEFSYRPVASSFSNWIFYRLADVILMKAEALTQKAILDNNNQELLTEAKELVGEIRTRANAPESTDMFYKQVGSMEGRTMEEFIVNERAREFAFEGKRWFDVLRHAKRDNYSVENAHYLTRLAILAAPPEKAYSLLNKWTSNTGSHYLPISLDELDTNKKLVQNEFYR